MKLIVCIVLDIIGYASYAFPALGEMSDMVWAPLSAFLFYKMFGGKDGKIGGLVQFTEEILPFTDFIPTFTLGYFFSKMKK